MKLVCFMIYIRSSNRKRNYMENIIVLGTGAGITINCYSLSAVLENSKGEYLLIDT